ncbi:unnamed protein product, partial [Polarella glacialis]
MFSPTGALSTVALLSTGQSGVHSWGLGNEACWSRSQGFADCCLDGKANCWQGVVTRERCCQAPEEGSEDHAELSRVVQEELHRCETSFEACVEAFADLLHHMELEQRLLLSESSLLKQQHFLALKELVVSWYLQNLRDLSSRLPEVLQAYSDRRPANPSREPRVGILVSCTPGSAGSDGCRLGASLYQCYAYRHGYTLIYDTNDFPLTPKVRFGEPTGSPVLHAVDAEFGEQEARFFESKFAIDFKWWQRWYAARRHLPFYDLLLVVDADTAVFPSCTGVGLLQALGLEGIARENWPGVMTRDIRPGEDLNGGSMVITSSPWGQLYLELLLAKSRWPIDVAGTGGWCHSRQGAELQSFLEVMALERSHVTGNPVNQSYMADCLGHALPNKFRPKRGADGTANTVLGCTYGRFFRCWRNAASRLAGPPGRRITKLARLVDPAKVDLNYRPWSQERRYAIERSEGEELPPLQQGAFIWHYVGLSPKVPLLMRDFQLDSIRDTLD